MRKILFFITLAISNIAVQAMEPNIVASLKQENQQKEAIYCPICLADSAANKPLNNSCTDCIGFKTNDGKKFRFALAMVPEHWKMVQNMTAKQDEGYVILQDFNSNDLALFTLSMLAKNKNDFLNKLQLSIEQIKEDYDALLLSLQDPQTIADLMEKTLQWTADPKEISPLAERFVLLVQDADFDVVEFAKIEGISPAIISAVVSWFIILNKVFVIPNDNKGHLVKTNISFKDWAEHNDATKKIKKADYRDSYILDLSELCLSDIDGLTDFLEKHGSKIDTINLSRNKISGLQPGVFSNCHQLQTVYLYYNQISGLQPGVFSNCPRLEAVDLSGNQISALQPGIFSNCPLLQRVYLSYNRISGLQPGVFSNCPLITNNWEKFKVEVMSQQTNNNNNQ